MEPIIHSEVDGSAGNLRLVGGRREVVVVVEVVDPLDADAEVRIGRQRRDVPIGVLVLPGQLLDPPGDRVSRPLDPGASEVAAAEDVLLQGLLEAGLRAPDVVQRPSGYTGPENKSVLL